ncbi:TNF receptor-associated factor 1-like [Python bivittatus]|uniref:TNF receptor-associated factor 1-like n=1 Tax=Python bivittatus TaxID=176946 RepID=A0A9F5J4A8_PYTBI|nr:TNF receptor-associated factor 1-like [Python bivittatus]
MFVWSILQYSLFSFRNEYVLLLLLLLASHVFLLHAPQAFYTARYGYKLCLKLFLNGDGTGAGTHLSLFLVLMKGEYDFQLKWPFRHKVTFTLLDQVNNRHISTSFRSLESSSSFQRPINETNVASGLPEFYPLNSLHDPRTGYICNDMLAIQAVIDTKA